MGMSVTIDNDFHRQKHEVMASLATIRDELEESVRQELDQIMREFVLPAAIDLCPKETGALASSISLESGAIQAGDFYGNSISAGSPDIVNPISGKPTSEYAQLVHDGHAIGDSFWEGVPFLVEALLMYESEIEACVDRAMKELGSITPSASKVAEMSD